MATPGPWKAIRRRGGTSEVWSADGEQCVADRVFNGNGELIAAAPDLLAALEEILSELHREGEVDRSHLEAVIGKAIARAKGEQQ